jgi:hypothetical protein
VIDGVDKLIKSFVTGPAQVLMITDDVLVTASVHAVTRLAPRAVPGRTFIVAIPLKHGIKRGDTEPSAHVAPPVMLNNTVPGYSVTVLLLTSVTRHWTTALSDVALAIIAVEIVMTRFATVPGNVTKLAGPDDRLSPDAVTVTLPATPVDFTRIVPVPFKHKIERGDTEPSCHVAIIPLVNDMVTRQLPDCTRLFDPSYKLTVITVLLDPSAGIPVSRHVNWILAGVAGVN